MAVSGAAIAKATVTGAKIISNLLAVFSVIYLTKKEMEETLQDATPMMEGMEDLPPKSQRDISAIYPEAKTLFDMVKDIYKGEYKPEDPFAITTAVLSIAYLVSPVEKPEEIQIDDVKTMSYAVGVCAKELKKYKELKNNQATSIDIEPVISTDPYSSPA